MSERLLAASKALAEKLEEVSDDLLPIFAEMQLVRGRGPYTGATYGEELKELNAAIVEIETKG